MGTTTSETCRNRSHDTNETKTPQAHRRGSLIQSHSYQLLLPSQSNLLVHNLTNKFNSCFPACRFLIRIVNKWILCKSLLTKKKGNVDIKVRYSHSVAFIKSIKKHPHLSDICRIQCSVFGIWKLFIIIIQWYKARFR